MIVQQPPYDLVVLCADQDAEEFFKAFVEKGQDAHARQCLRAIRWRPLRDPRRDTVWQATETLLRPFSGDEGTHFLVLWDHHGSGAGDPRTSERAVVERVRTLGVSEERIEAVVFEPELEVLFAGSWGRVAEVIRKPRASEVGPEEVERSLLLRKARRRHPRLPWPADFETALGQHPKELFEALVHACGRRTAAPLYRDIADRVSLTRLKKSAVLERVASTLEGWFPVAAG